jgi:cell filamentation protein
MAYDVDKDPYLDKESGVLRNLLNIKTEQELEDAEARLTSVEITLLTSENVSPYDEFDVELFLSVHRQLFKEIYDWAGELRTIELSKGTTSFARAEHLAASLEDIIGNLKKDNYLVDFDFDDFIAKLAHYYADLIVLHPFREGNGRTIRTFLAMLAESIDWHIAWDEMNAQENIDASIAGYQGDEKPLRDMLAKLVTPVDIFWGRDPYKFIE